jgi:predicted transcriptional regulator
LRLLSPDFKSSNQPKLQLTTRLDELQRELNKKNEESNAMEITLSDISENMERKIEENKDLLLKLSSLEERNKNLELELSAFRASQCKEEKSVNKIASPNSSVMFDSTYI